MRPARQLQDAVVNEEAQHRVEIVGVERVSQVLQRLDGYCARVRHANAPPSLPPPATWPEAATVVAGPLDDNDQL
jgi:hypothetical protein